MYPTVNVSPEHASTIPRHRNSIQEKKMNGTEQRLTEEDHAILILLALSLLLSVFIPFLLVISPTLITEGPLLISITLLAMIGPGLIITLHDMRFLLSGVFLCIFINPSAFLKTV